MSDIKEKIRDFFQSVRIVSVSTCSDKQTFLSNYGGAKG